MHVIKYFPIYREEKGYLIYRMAYSLLPQQFSHQVLLRIATGILPVHTVWLITTPSLLHEIIIISKVEFNLCMFNNIT
jgi:hypothetical protein